MAGTTGFAPIVTAPCEEAYSLLLGAEPADNELHLTVRAVSGKAGGLYVSGEYASGSSDLTAEHPSVRFHLPVSAGLAMPVSSASCELLVLRYYGSLSVGNKCIDSLLAEVERIVAPEGEIFFCWRENPEGADRPSRLERLRSLLDLRWMLVFRRVLRLRAFSYAQGVVAAYSGSGALSQLFLVKGYGALRQRFSSRQLLRIVSMRNCSVRASPSPLRDSRLFEACNQASKTVAGEQACIALNTILVSPKEKLVILLDINSEGFVLKMPFSAAATADCRNNVQNLRELGARFRPGELAPIAIWEQSTADWYGSLESRIEGSPLKALNQAEGMLSGVEELLRALGSNSEGHQSSFDEEFFAEMVSKQLQHLEFAIGADKCALLSRFFEESLLGTQVYLGRAHGDFTISNIYSCEDQSYRVIDWDGGSNRGLTVLDAIGHLVSLQCHRLPCVEKAIVDLAKRDWLSASELDFLDRLYQYFNVPSDQHVPLVILYWLQIVGGQTQYWFGFDAPAIRRRADVICAFLAETHSK